MLLLLKEDIFFFRFINNKAPLFLLCRPNTFLQLYFIGINILYLSNLLNDVRSKVTRGISLKSNLLFLE